MYQSTGFCLIVQSDVYEWSDLYIEHGKEALQYSKNRCLFLAEKLNLIAEVKNGKSLCEAAILVNFVGKQKNKY